MFSGTLSFSFFAETCNFVFFPHWPHHTHTTRLRDFFLSLRPADVSSTLEDMIRSPTTSQLRVSTLVSQRTKVSSCLATSTPMPAWSPSSVRASPAASPRPSWRCVRDPDSHVPEASPTLATRIALPDASAADRGSSGGDLGPARFRVSSQIAPRMILAHRRVARIPWMPPRGHHRRRARDLARRFVTLGNRRRIQLA